VREYSEPASSALPKYHFTVESAPVDSDDWKELTEDITDNDVAIPTGQIKFVNDLVAYVYLWRVFASTTDGGQTWRVWDARKEVPRWRCCNQAYIINAHIEPDGRGVMTLAPKFRDIDSRELGTTDFGQQWSYLTR
jgi:hypothetical protein